MFNLLRKKVLLANKELGKSKLTKLNWGNVSEIDRKRKAIAIKPSGVNYNKLQLKDIPVVSLNGKKIYGNLRPSSDLDTHLEIYKKFKNINGICHAHSKYATIFCQANKEIKCIGTTHADYFKGNIPLTRKLTKNEIKNSYVKNTGKAIVDTFSKRGINVNEIPAILVRGHAPFTMGINAEKAFENLIVLEEVAEMYFKTIALENKIKFDPYLLIKHFERKNGKKKYYGQK